MPLTASHWDIEARKYGDVFAKFNTPAKFHAYFAEFVETGEALVSSSITSIPTKPASKLSRGRSPYV